ESHVSASSSALRAGHWSSRHGAAGSPPGEADTQRDRRGRPCVVGRPRADLVLLAEIRFVGHGPATRSYTVSLARPRGMEPRTTRAEAESEVVAGRESYP